MIDKLKHYKLLWDLSDDGELFSTHSSLLQPVIYNGMKCMLKIAMADEELRGNFLMVWYNGNAVPSILKHDKSALLMERATGANSLAAVAKNSRDDEANRIICSVVINFMLKKHLTLKTLCHFIYGSMTWDQLPLNMAGFLKNAVK